ncbi:MAG: fasciclin [Bacteroidaceae bacterium]|nr:fasciclin [Bacteroidaceae bacterium]
MKSKRFLKGMAWGLLSLPLALCSCEDEMTDDPHYKPQVRTGSAYQQLQEDGKYTIFLQGVDLAGFTGIVDGKNLMTVMAPDDVAFQKYLQEQGFSSIQEMYEQNPQSVIRLIGFHLMYYSYDWNKLVNFRPLEGDGATEEESNRDAGLYFKHRTHSSSPITLEYNPVLDTEVKVYHFDRLLPVFSSRLFQTLGIDAKTNYEYFYPNSTWTGSREGGGFNVANASVLDEESVITDNGYLYHIDQVLDPVESLHATLKSNPKYSKYIELYDNYTSYVENVDLSTDFGGGDKVYLHSHNASLPLPNIAYEWMSPYYQSFSTNCVQGYTIFAPTNEAITEFFNSYWTEEGGYTSFDELDPLIKEYFIMQTFASTSYPVFPSMLKPSYTTVNGKPYVTDYYDMPIAVDPETVTDRCVCSNGFLYGMDNMAVPSIFSSVVGAAFNNMAYRNFLYVLSTSDQIGSLASDQMSFIAMMPDTTKFAVDAANMPIQKSGNSYVIKEWDDVNGVYGDMSSSTAQAIVNMHVAPNVEELPLTGTAVVETNTPFNYLFVRDGKVTTNYLFNNYLSPEYAGDPFVPFKKVYEGSNGTAYAYEGKDLFQAGTGDGLEHTLSVCNDKDYPYYLFSQLLQKAGMVQEGKLPSIVPDEETRFIAFVPTNEAIKNNIKNIPGASNLKIADDYRISGTVNTSNKALLSAYLRSYFITSILTPFAKYPYAGAGVQGTFATFGSNQLNLVDTGNSLQVNFVGGESETPVNVVEDYGFLPFAYQDGCFHFIEDILK